MTKADGGSRGEDSCCDSRASGVNNCAMNSYVLASLPVTKPVAIGLGLAALCVLYLAFKAAKFLIKALLVLAALIALSLAVWWFYNAHHGTF
jgi:hypothetical protein